LNDTQKGALRTNKTAKEGTVLGRFEDWKKKWREKKKKKERRRKGAD